MDSDNSPIIWARSLTKSYGHGPGPHEVVAVNGVDLDIQQGELVLLKGNSGSGKSTLLSLLGGLDLPTGGRLRVADHDLTKVGPAVLTRFRREVVGMVFQSFNLLPTLTVMENVCLPALLAGHDRDVTRKKALDLLYWLNMKERITHLPAQLSGGEMQRCAIARALINDPRIILADEPTGNLDSRNGEAVMELIKELHRTFGRTIVLATHSDLADRHATLEIFLKDGSIVERP